MYKKYIKKNGKIFGPYYYESHREGGKVKTSYVKKPEEKIKEIKQSEVRQEVKSKPQETRRNDVQENYNRYLRQAQALKSSVVQPKIVRNIHQRRIDKPTIFLFILLFALVASLAFISFDIPSKLSSTGFSIFSGRGITGMASICGDGRCEPPAEDCRCGSDCGCPSGSKCVKDVLEAYYACVADNPCGNGVCDPGENIGSCPYDCQSTCGDGICWIGQWSNYHGESVQFPMETCGSCPSDCVCRTGYTCKRDDSNQLSCVYHHCGDGDCDGGETSQDCPQDCGGWGCGDRICSPDEDCNSCSNDCGCVPPKYPDHFCASDFINNKWVYSCKPTPKLVCGDRLCMAGEDIPGDTFYCPQDCGGGTCNNNGVCQQGETNENCPLDCPLVGCGDGICQTGFEDCTNCPTDCSSALHCQGFCGDGACDPGETIANCPEDCFGTCTPDCTGKQCGDDGCGNLTACGGCGLGKTCVDNICIVGNGTCTPDWRCTDWSECIGASKVRSCQDLEECDMPETKPEEIVPCNWTCTERWQCDWTGCINEVNAPTNCRDVNECGTNDNKPTSRTCSPDLSPEEEQTCKPDVLCGNWSACTIDYDIQKIINGISTLNLKQTRECIDKNECSLPSIQEKICGKLKIKIEKKKICFVDVIDIFDENNTFIGRITPSGLRFDRLDIEFFITQGEKSYCSYCYDNVKDYDEEDTDCGGSCISCSVKLTGSLIKTAPSVQTDWRIYIYPGIFILIIILGFLLFLIFWNRRKEDLKKEILLLVEKMKLMKIRQLIISMKTDKSRAAEYYRRIKTIYLALEPDSKKQISDEILSAYKLTFNVG